MSTVDKYLVREVLKHFGIVLLAAIGIYVAVDFFENVDKFVNAGLPAARIIEFFQLKLPLIIAQITPVGILLAILITFGLMNKHNEIIALKSGGMSVYYFLRPVFTLGFLFSVFLFFLSEIVVPVTISKANEIWRIEVKKYAVTSVQKNIWLKGHRSIAYISYFNPRDRTISGIALNYFDQQFRLIRRIDAAKGIFLKDRWVFYDIMEQILDKKTGAYEVKFHDQQAEELDFAPEDLQRVAKKSEEMSFRELLDYIRNVESEGYDATPYRVDFHDKFALPFACLIVSVIGVGITARKLTRKDLSVNIAYGIVIVFLFWISHGFCLSLGYGGILPPLIAAWTANFIFGCAAAFVLLNAE
jgi:lipopolysaccharide export system permease protein